MRELLYTYCLLTFGVLWFVGVTEESVEEDLSQREARYEVYENRHGEVWWRLKTPTGQVIASGEGFRGREHATQDIETVREYAAVAPVEQLQAR